MKKSYDRQTDLKSGLFQNGESNRGAHDSLQSRRGLLFNWRVPRQEWCARVFIDWCIKLSSGPPLTHIQPDSLPAFRHLNSGHVVDLDYFSSESGRLRLFDDKREVCAAEKKYFVFSTSVVSSLWTGTRIKCPNDKEESPNYSATL